MIFLASLYFVLGLCIASFSNVLIYRMPVIAIKKQKAKEGIDVGEIESISFPSSHCQNCLTPLKWYHNIPVFSWLFLGGKCAFCKSKISIQYPIIELLGGLFMLVGFFIEVGSFNYLELFKALIIGTLFIILLAMSIIDLRYTAAPDELLYTSVVLALLYSFSLKGITDALIIAGIFTLLALIVSLIKRRFAMGSADIFIFAAMGAVLGLNLAFIAIFIAAIVSLPAFFIAAQKDYELPFIPFLSFGLFVTYSLEMQILDILNQIYG
ncbi:prepilin peptidase [Campylobacter corcagiensis]|uniref:Prepilin peptidase n=1 Tax=Campylobacter corcagiensis TaxID=1448857 RepID=A0A7M1LKY8_9BACT|nr:A24 family peptidase [Campylobacter corcagiensis]QOQ88185.1 prepilin peptidase [Campylobacter corcagiensis]